MKHFILSVILLFALIGCDSTNKNEDKVSTESTTDTAFAGFVDTTLAGIYQAVLPCNDCESRLHTVMLNADGSFRLEEEFIGKGISPSITNGTWNYNENNVRLITGNVVLFSYALQNDSLKLSIPPGDNSEVLFFTLQKKPTNKHTAWQDKWKSGADFFGIGTEPFWSVEIDNEKMLTLTFADRITPITIQSPKPRDVGDSLVYEGNDAKGKLLRVTIYANFCNDGMSDFIYEHTVRVSYEGMQLQGCGRIKE